MKKWILLCWLMGIMAMQGQEQTASEVLEKSIAFHDPDGQWKSFDHSFEVVMETPNRPRRHSKISINLPKQFFRVVAKRGDTTTDMQVAKDSCNILLNGSANYSQKEAENHRLSCERTKMYRDYYTYLYGLPMKLKDPGTIIHPKLLYKRFKGKKYVVLKVTYDPKVGKDVWYFYFDPETYAMEVYQFFHEEAKNDGEYILLTGLKKVNGIQMPKDRAWYYNRDDKYLGTDKLQ
ncbi:MAG: DUF6503 family protein [Flavobacteriaceae bacterium]|nr:DUF6503 family protein [Flavobacteriaceae bacterium]